MTRSFIDALHATFHDPDSGPYRVVEAIIVVLILLSIGLFVAELVVGASVSKLWVDQAILAIFAVEISLRILTYRPPALAFYKRGALWRAREHVVGRLRYAVRPMNLIDLFTVLAIFPVLRGLRALRLLRLVRTTRFFKYSNPFGGLAKSFEDNRLLYTMSFTWLASLVFLGGLSIWLVDRDDPQASVKTLSDGLWWSLVTLTTVGYGDYAPNDTLGRFIGGALMVGGMFTLALFAGVVGQTLLGAVLSIREEQFRMSGYIDHVVVCGYDESANQLIRALRAEVEGGDTRIVVFAKGDRPQSLPVDVTWIQGDPTKESEVEKARVTHARTVVIVGSRETTPQHADANTVLTVFTIRRFLRRANDTRRRRPLYIVAEILDHENVEHARAAGADEVIESTRLGFSLLAHAVFQPGTGHVMSQVALTNDQNLYVGILPDEIATPAPFGDVAHALYSAHGVVVIGVIHNGKELINPPASHQVMPQERVVYLAGESKLSS